MQTDWREVSLLVGLLGGLLAWLAGVVASFRFNHLLRSRPGESAMPVPPKNPLDQSARDSLRYARGLLSRAYARHPDSSVRFWGDVNLISLALFCLAFVAATVGLLSQQP
jgi:hypothetical protein